MYSVKLLTFCNIFFCFVFQGGFAKCYELTDMETNHIYAGKIVAKALLMKQHQREKVGLLHSHVWGFKFR